MNYPFDPHNTSSENSRNQFMLQDQSISSNFIGNSNTTVPKDMQKLFSYMKNVMSNPMLMDQMEKFLSVKQTQKNSSFVSRQNQSLSISRMENDMRQLPDSYIIQTSQMQRPQPLRMGTKQQVRQFKTSQITVSNIITKKSSNIPAPYAAKQIMESNSAFQSNYSQADKFNKFQSRPNNFQQPRNKFQQKSQPLPLKTTVSFEDVPIKSNYIAGQQYGHFDAGMQRLAEYPQNESQFFQNNPRKVVKQAIPKNKSKTFSSNQNIVSNNSNTFSNKYIQAEQRPINGTNKDFKQLLKQKALQSPFDDKPLPGLSNNVVNNNWAKEEYDEYPNQDEQNQDERKPKKQFLKRGTRQYLSSAKDKKSVVKPIKNKEIQQTLNTSRFGGQKQRDKTPTKRDVSQNRILSKRNTTNNDKSVSKLKSRDNLNTSNNESFYQQKQEENTKRSITPKNERLLPKSKSPILQPRNNKTTNNSGKTNVPTSRNQGSGKKKNVFDDSSSSIQENSPRQNQNQNDDEEEYESIRSNNLIENKKTNQFEAKNNNTYQPDKQFNMFSREKKQEILDGVYLTKSQLDTILQKYSPKVTTSTKDVNASQQKFNQLRKKYTDLCNLVEKQKIQHEQQMEKEREEFQSFKQQEIQKLKNQKRVMERQVKSSMPSQSQNLQKDKEQVQNLKKELEKEKQEHKKKEKNNKILIEKYKKENQELKFRFQKLQEQVQKLSSSSLQNNFSSAGTQRQTVSSANLRSNAINDKSKSKAVVKDVSPGKGKMNKSSKVLEQNAEQEPVQDKNYKKTVPLYKGQQQKKSISPSINQNNKKSMGSKNFEENLNSDDQNLPTFKIDNKKVEQTKTKTQKKYQYVENSVQSNQNIKQNQSTHNRKNSGHQNKFSSKNVFADDSDQENHEKNQQNEDEYDQQGERTDETQQKYQSLSDLMTTKFSIKNVTPYMIENLFRHSNNTEYCRYVSRLNNPKRIIVNSSKNGVDKKITNIYNDKSKQILFQNGVKKEMFEDGYTIIYFKNGDIKQKLTDGTILYYFKEKQVDQITLINGLNVYRFENNQVELHFNEGKYIEIMHPDGTIKLLGQPVN